VVPQERPDRPGVERGRGKIRRLFRVLGRDPAEDPEEVQPLRPGAHLRLVQGIGNPAALVVEADDDERRDHRRVVLQRRPTGDLELEGIAIGHVHPQIRGERLDEVVEDGVQDVVSHERHLAISSGSTPLLVAEQVIV
jgi:hypothetical protein